MPRAAFFLLALSQAAICAPIQLTVSGYAQSSSFVFNGPAGATEFSFGPHTTGALTASGTSRATIASNSISVSLTGASFACPAGCGPGYGLYTYLTIPVGSLPQGPLDVAVELSGTASLGFTILFDIQTLVGTLDETFVSSGHALASGPFSVTPARPDVLLPAYPPEENAYVYVGFFGWEGSYFEGSLQFPDSMTITVTSVPEPSAAPLIPAVLALLMFCGAGCHPARRLPIGARRRVGNPPQVGNLPHR